MRINLDYYRILRVPIKADPLQLEQAYQDRLQQQSRHEYSESAVVARRTLLEKAYKVLSDPRSRMEYDRNFFTPVEPDSPTSEEASENQEAIPEDSQPKFLAASPYLEIEPQLLPGALIVLYELAEYEMVVSLGNDYLYQDSKTLESKVNNSGNTAYTATLTETQGITDVLLCLALSYLEVSREQWRKKQWEQAAISGQMALNLLQHDSKNLFPTLQAEINSELNLLKPYRILDLLACHSPGSSYRNKGLKLLRSMLAQRGDIAADRNDPFGLKLEQFLQFIQQIRTYLTLSEQKEIFLAEAKRGSHPSSCVAAYALIAEGYALKQPPSIIEAQTIFKDLSRSQNTYWEQAICALLLGQTEESQAILQQGKDRQILDLIQQHSQNAPDMLPGLCFYGEQWLQQEVLCQFKDLKSHKMTLRDYFGDRKVQAYLEKIVPSSNTKAETTSSSISPQITSEPTRLQQLFPWWKNKNKNQPQVAASVSQQSPRVQTPVLATAGNSTQKSASYNGNSPTVTPTQKNGSVATASVKSPPVGTARNLGSTATKVTKNRRIVPKKKSSRYTPKVIFRSILLLLGLMGGIGAMGFLFTKSQLQQPQTAEQPPVESVTPQEAPIVEEQVSDLPIEDAVGLDASETVTSEPIPAEVEPTGLTPESARRAIQTWLDSKTAALGQQHSSEQLETILTGSLLTQWRDRSTYYKQTNTYRTFDHSLNIRSVKVNPDNSDLATVEAEVKETAQHYQAGTLNQQQSYSDNLLVRYELIRQDDSWLIKNSEVLQSL